MHIFDDLSQDVMALEYPNSDFDPPKIELIITINDDKGIGKNI